MNSSVVRRDKASPAQSTARPAAAQENIFPILERKRKLGIQRSKQNYAKLLDFTNICFDRLFVRVNILRFPRLELRWRKAVLW